MAPIISKCGYMAGITSVFGGTSVPTIDEMSSAIMLEDSPYLLRGQCGLAWTVW